MKQFIIRRIAAPKGKTFGALIHVQDDGDEIPIAVTLERDFDGGSNRPSEGKKPGACIPEGTYRCVRVDSPNFGDTFKVADVPDRTDILFHSGNISANTRGCILVGEEYATIDTEEGIARSRDGMREFLSLLKGQDEFQLVIENRFL